MIYHLFGSVLSGRVAELRSTYEIRRRPLKSDVHIVGKSPKSNTENGILYNSAGGVRGSLDMQVALWVCLTGSVFVTVQRRAIYTKREILVVSTTPPTSPINDSNRDSTPHLRLIVRDERPAPTSGEYIHWIRRSDTIWYSLKEIHRHSFEVIV